MKLTALGKYGPYPKEGTASSSYLVEDGDTLLLLDMGSATLSRLIEKIDVNKLDGIFLSHLHFDHTCDLLPFRYLLEDLNKTINIYVRPEDTEWSRVLLSHKNFSIIPIDVSSMITVGSLKLRFFEMKHTVPNLAVRIEGEKTLVYTGDTVYTENIIAAAKDADYLLADCSKPADFTGPHMNYLQAVELQRLTGVKIFATHLSPSYDPSEELSPYADINVIAEMVTYTL